MKNYILTSALIVVMCQPQCLGMLKAESQLALPIVSDNICKIIFENTVKPVDKDTLMKYFLVKSAIASGPVCHYDLKPVTFDYRHLNDKTRRFGLIIENIEPDFTSLQRYIERLLQASEKEIK